jgi:D-amino peptidase
MIRQVNTLKSVVRISRLILLAFYIFMNPLSAQIKIYVNTDLEGISGVFKFEQTREKDTPLNIQACEYFMGDVAAVVKGLLDGGASEVVVLDGHGSQAVIPHLMVPGAKYITGRPRPGAGNLSELDSSFAGMVMLGFHAMMGTPDGVLNHTQSSRSENRYWYNDVESGELAQNAAIAAIPLCKPYIIKTPIKVREEYLNLDPSLPKPVLVKREGVAENALHLFTWSKKQ